jgi:hypothetical protein
MEKAAKSPAAAKTFDRKADDVGNILFLDHINLNILDQRNATVFYVMGLGLTRDPYMRVGIFNMGINVGRSQFHLPTAGRTDLPAAQGMTGGTPTAQVVRGTMGLVMLDQAALAKRLEKVAPLLQDTQFSYKVHADRVDATCPWGNRFRCHAPNPELGETDLAVSYIEFDVPRGAAAGIGRFYRDGFLAVVKVEQQSSGAVAIVNVGVQKFLFRETDAPIPPHDGHHIAIYIANHSDPHRFLKEHNVRVEESDAHQYRFWEIIDPDTGKELFTLEHEVRSMRHPQFDKPLINRNPDQTNNYRSRGYDAFRGVY